MEKQKILDFLRENNNFYTTKILRQHWRHNSYSYADMPRPDFGVMLVLSGTARFEIGEERIEASAGNILFLPKGSRYEAIFDDEIDDYLVSFDYAGDLIDVDAPVKLVERVPLYCVERFRELISENFSGNHSALKSHGLFYLLLDAVANNIEGENDTHRVLVSRARELLSNGEMSVGEIAKECAVSESGLRHIFKEQTGMTPIEYRLYARIKEAAYLLEATGMSVSEIADRLGFFDAAYFCKVFKEYTGVTPKQYSLNKKL